MLFRFFFIGFRFLGFFVRRPATKVRPKSTWKTFHTRRTLYSFARTTAWTTTSITLTGYKQQYVIMRLKLKGNHKPLFVCYECHWQDSLFRFQAMRLMYPFQWVTGIERRRTLIITWKLRWSYWISKITMKIWIWSLLNKLTITIRN